LDPGKVFDARMPLVAACEAYPEDEMFALLNAYVLLVSEVNQTREVGYAYLRQAFDKLQTGQLLYNLIRVGARLNIDHEAEIAELEGYLLHDLEKLGNCYTLQLYMYLVNGQPEDANRFYDDKRRKERAQQCTSPFLKFIVLLQQQAYERIAAEAVSPEVYATYRKLMAD